MVLKLLKHTMGVTVLAALLALLMTAQSRQVEVGVPATGNNTEISYEILPRNISGNITTPTNATTTCEPKCGFLTFPWKTLGIIIGISLGGSVTLVFVVFPLLLCMCGFACRGVRHNSGASHWQSDIGNVEEGSCFACCQSAGAGGKIITMMLIAVFLWIGVSVLAGYFYIKPMCAGGC